MSLRGILVAVMSILGLAAYDVGAATAANWPRFRGPNGVGAASDKDIPIEWSDSKGLVWKVAIPGAGNSSPVIWGDKIFLESATDDERQLLCLGTGDGKILWTKSISGARSKKHPKNTLASSTPATDGERVYTLFWTGTALEMHAYDFGGEQVWKRSLGAFKSQHGVGQSPVVYNGMIFLNNDQDGSANLVALNAKTGATVWQAPRKAFRSCYSTPFIQEEQGKPAELVVTSTAGVSSYNPKTGAVNWNWSWQFDGKGLRTVGSSVASAGLIFATSGDGDGSRHAVAVKPKGKVAVKIWENKKSLPYVPCMIPSGKHLYFVNDKGSAGCVEAASGKMVFFERIFTGDVTASPVLIDGKVYAISDKGEVAVFPADPTFRLLAKTKLSEGVMASPAVADGRLYIRGKENLYCIGKASSK